MLAIGFAVALILVEEQSNEERPSLKLAGLVQTTQNLVSLHMSDSEYWEYTYEPQLR